MAAYCSTLPRENIAKLYCGIFCLPLCLCLYGLLLPADWAQHFGALAVLVQWAGKFAPVVGKCTAASPNPALMAGFVGLAVYMPPLLGLWLCRWALFDFREPGRPRLILAPPYHPAWLWGFLWGFACFALYLLYAAPRSFPHGTNSAYEHTITTLLGSRIFIAVCGAFVTVVAGATFACVFGFPVRFWARITGKEKLARARAGAAPMAA